MAALAEEQHMPVENLLTPELVRRLCWEPCADDDHRPPVLPLGLEGVGRHAWVGVESHLEVAIGRRGGRHETLRAQDRAARLVGAQRLHRANVAPR